MTLGIGKAGSSSAQQVQDIQRRTSEHELDQIKPVKPEVTPSREGSVSPRQLSIPGSFPATPPRTKFQMSAQLKSEATRLGKHKQQMSIDYLSDRMKAEGRLIADYQAHAELTGASEDAFVNFPDLAGKLGLETTLPDDVNKLSADLLKNLDNLAKADSPDHTNMHEMAGVLKTMLADQTKLFASHAAQYEEVRKLPDSKLSKDDRANILLSELSFSAYATKSICAVPDIVSAAHTKAIEVAKALRAEPGNEEEAEKWEVTAHQLQGVQEDILPDFKNAVDQAKLSLLVKEYQDTSSSYKNQGLAFLGQGLRQMGLSGLALGAARAFTLAGLESSPVGKLFGAGVTTAIAHEVGTHLLAPAILDVVGGATVPIDSAKVLPAVNKLVSENGVVRPRTKAELDAATEENDALRAEHGLSKNANKVGTGAGELKGWSMFALVQGARAGITSDMDLSRFREAGAITLGSMFAGFFMGGIHGADGLNAKMKDQTGRPLPAHTMKKPSTGPVGKRMEGIAKDGVKKLDPRDAGNVRTNLNKAAGLTTGMAIAEHAGKPILNAVAESSPAVKAGVTAVTAGMQSILLLNQAWGAFGISARVKEDKTARDAERAKTSPETAGARAPASPGAYEATRTVLRDVGLPGRLPGSHSTLPGTAGFYAENANIVSQGIGGLPGAVVNDTVMLAGKLVGSKSKPDPAAPTSGGDQGGKSKK
jgi:hypothetical protein